jgi:hypothetical protein
MLVMLVVPASHPDPMRRLSQEIRIKMYELMYEYIDLAIRI